MRKKRNVNRLLTAILTMVMLITTVAQSGTVAYASEYFEDAIVEVSVSDEAIEETIDISEEGIGEAVENSNEVEGEEKSDLEQIVESEIATENSILPEAEEIVEEESFEEIVISEEAMYASTVINIYSDTASIDNMASEGWNWDLESATLTLDGANLNKGLYFFCDATVNVLSDSTIDSAVGNAIRISGSKAQNFAIQGSGTLHLVTRDSTTAALITSNDSYEHNVTISGSSLTVLCENNYGDNAVLVCGGSLIVTDKATLSASVNTNTAALYCMNSEKVVVKNGGTINVTKPGASPALRLSSSNNELDIIDGGIVNVFVGEGNAIYADKENAIINISGKGSIVNVEYTDTSRPSSAAISAGSTGNITITDGGKLVCNNVSPHSTGLIYAKDVDVDISGGIIEAHTAATKVFGTGASMVLAKSVNYNEGAANNAYYDGSASYKVIHINKSADHFLYADLIQFTSVPKSSMGVKTGNTLELSVDTEVINTDEIPVITYQWYKDGAKIVGASDATYETPALSDGKYTYKCEVQATFTVGTVTLSTEDIKVFVNAQGRTTADGLYVLVRNLLMKL